MTVQSDNAVVSATNTRSSLCAHYALPLGHAQVSAVVHQVRESGSLQSRSAALLLPVLHLSSYLYCTCYALFALS